MKISNRVSGAKIAAELGISQATVSRALNGNPRISQAMREQVQKTAMRLGYVANATARTLVKGRSNIIGILTGGLNIERTGNLLMILEEKLRERGLLTYLFYTGSETEKIKGGIRHLLEQGVDGLIVIGVSDGLDANIPQELFQIKPIVFIDDLIKGDNINIVTNGFDEVLRDLKQHLDAQKRKHIFALWKPMEKSRLESIKSLLKQFGQEDNIVYSQYYNPRSEAEIQEENINLKNTIRQLLNDHPECDAIICYNDHRAFSTLSMLNDFGRSSPRDISIIGFDNQRLGELFTPRLSTITPQHNLIADATINRLLELIEKPQDDAKTIKIQAKFIQRET